MKKYISPKQFVDMVNEEIKATYGYITGMEIFLVPNTDNPMGYGWEEQWNESNINFVVSVASHKILENHEVAPWLNRSS
jgi:hypothetical protein